MRGIDRREDEELTPSDLVMAARAGNVNRVIDILQHPHHPIAPNAVDEEGQTALYAALMMVLNNEAVESEDDLKDDLMTCWEKFKLKITRCLKSTGQSAKLDLVIKILTYKGAFINWVREEKDGDGEGVLHVAAKRGAKSFISWMIKKGANIDIKTGRDKKTPLMFAADGNHLDAVFMLLKEGAMTSINAEDIDGRTALHYAATKGTPQLCTVMLICGAKINARTKLGRLPLEEAEVRGRTGVVVALRTYIDRTPLWKRRVEFYEDMYMPTLAEGEEGIEEE
jgi:ankyrin repeat protein